MEIRRRLAVLLRLFLLAALIWSLAAVVSPDPGPVLIDLLSLTVMLLFLAVPFSRRPIVAWIRTGRLRRAAP